MEERLPISVCMISGPEASRIGRSLESVTGWVAEIIVVLNTEVNDGTDAIAGRYGAKIYREAWKGHIAQKNSAASKAGQTWLFGLDADEAVSSELRNELQGLFAERTVLERFAAYSVPRLTMFCGRWIRHGDWYPDRGARLWRKGQADWGGVDPHDKLLVRGPIGRLHGQLLHHNAAGFDDQIAKIAAYSEDFLRHASSQGNKAAWWDLAVRPGWRFFRSYILRRGFLDGWQGYYIARMTAFYSLTRYAKVRNLQQRKMSPSQ
jgi:glycosyltransferase involved in cell wall biosynthesis